MLYCVCGGAAKKLVGCWVAIKPAGPVQSIDGSALNSQRENAVVKVVRIEVPTGNKRF